MSKYERVALGSLVSEYSERNRALACTEVYSVTNSEGFMPSADYFSKEVFSKNISSYKIVRRGMFAYNPSRVNVGSISWLDCKDTVVISPMYVVFKIDENRLTQSYLDYFLHSGFGTAQIRGLTSGSVRDTLKYSALQQIKIPLPPLDEQRRIAVTLEKTQQVIATRHKQITVLDKLAKDQFYEMFGGNKFDLVPLDAVCDFITKGTTPPLSQIFSENGAERVPYLKVYNLSLTGELLFWQEPQFVEKATHTGVLARSKVYPGDVLMNIVGPPLGKFALVSDEFPEYNINQAIAIFRSKERILPLYLMYALMQSKVLSPFVEQAVGIRQQNLNLKQCRELEIELPPLDLQQKYTEQIAAINKQKSRLSASLAELETLYKSLTERAFSGELFG